jgi:hypothetical protein
VIAYVCERGFVLQIKKVESSLSACSSDLGLGRRRTLEYSRLSLTILSLRDDQRSCPEHVFHVCEESRPTHLRLSDRIRSMYQCYQQLYIAEQRDEAIPSPLQEVGSDGVAHCSPQ